MVDECAHEGHRCLLAPRWHPRETQGPVILQAVPRGVEVLFLPVDIGFSVVLVDAGRLFRCAGHHLMCVATGPPIRGDPISH